jgi:L-alanine-DL-glutamate epimerase-like enolase superfamily enzyme
LKITDIKCHILLDPAFEVEATSSAQDDIVVEVFTDEGITGIGETDLNAWVARACIEAPGTHTMDRGLRDMLIGQNPLDPRAVWDKLYVGSAMTGRRGALVNAIGAIDIALWDICGKTAGVPSYKLMGDAVRDSFQPYASLLPEVETFREFVDALVKATLDAKNLGFRAAKLEVIMDGPYASLGLRATDNQMTEVVDAVRSAVGADFTLMVDVGYAWDSVERAVKVVRDWERYDLFFVETPLWTDDLEGYAELARRAPMKIAAGEWLTTRYEFIDLMDRGLVGVVQPDIGRVGGLTEAQRVCTLASERGLQVVPHAWKTGISIAAAAQLAAITPNMPFFEFLPGALAASALRRELVREELQIVDGKLPLPTRPGIGVELNLEAMERFEEAARRFRP